MAVAAGIGELFAIGVGGTGADVLDQEVNDFDSVKVNFHLYDGDSISFSIPALSPAAPYLSGLASDVFLYNKLDTTRSDHLWQRYRVQPIAQSWPKDGSSLIDVAAVDYKQLLKGRLLRAGDAAHPWFFVSVDEATIVAELINHTQNIGAAWQLGINTTLITATGQTRERTEYKPGDNIYGLIDALSKVLNGPVSQVKPTAADTRTLSVRKLDTFATWEMPVVWGDNATDLHREPGTFANAAFVPATNTTQSAFYTTPEAATDPRGVWEVAVSASTSVTTQTTIDTLAQGAATEMQRAPANWKVDMDVARWMGDSRYMPGDFVPVKVPEPNVDPPAPESATIVTTRCVEVALTIDNTGQAAVALALEEL